MRLGCYGSLAQAAQIKAAGFDFIEVDASAVLGVEQDSNSWVAQAPDVDVLPLPVLAAGDPIPDDQPIIGPQRNIVELQNLMQRAAKRAQWLGIRYLLLNNGRARRKPDQVDSQTAWEDLQSFAKMAGQIIGHHGVMLLMLPLEENTTNLINTVGQAKLFCDCVNDRRLGVAVDGGVFSQDRHDEESLLSLADQLKYVRVPWPASDGTSSGGVSPSRSDREGFEVEYFFNLLRKAGYDGEVTVALPAGDSWPGDEAAKRWVELLRRTWAGAGRFDD